MRQSLFLIVKESARSTQHPSSRNAFIRPAANTRPPHIMRRPSSTDFHQWRKPLLVLRQADSSHGFHVARIRAASSAICIGWATHRHCCALRPPRLPLELRVTTATISTGGHRWTLEYDQKSEKPLSGGSCPSTRGHASTRILLS